MKNSVGKICQICGGRALTNIDEDAEFIVNRHVIDSRKVNKNDCFIAIKGEANDGNLYVEAALENGASVCIVSKMPRQELINKYSDRTIILVENTIKALQDLASYKRSLYDIPVVAVTGSVGKTSTKDIIANVLGQNFNVLKTEGNYNNHIGLPLTLLGLEEHEVVVVEMGMNHFGEIRTLTNIAKPTIAVITNIGTSHIGNLGSRQNILKAKLEILEGLKEDGKIVINNDNDLLHDWAKSENNNNIITFGIENNSMFLAKNIVENENNTQYKININNQEYGVTVPVAGKHFVYNSLCAFAVGKALGMEPDAILKGIAEFKLTGKRMDFKVVRNNITVLADYYNASYDSVKSALEVIKTYDSKRKIAVLGDMLELGDFAKKIHEDVGEEVYKNNIDILITVGTLAKNIAKKAHECGVKHIYECGNNKEAIDVLSSIVSENDLILLKASNAMKFEEIMKALENL